MALVIITDVGGVFLRAVKLDNNSCPRFYKQIVDYFCNRFANSVVNFNRLAIFKAVALNGTHLNTLLY